MNYDESALQQVREDRLLIDRCDEWLFEEIEPFLGQRILEIGCGLGNLTRLLQDRELYVGIDSCDESISALRSLYKEHSNIEVIHLDVTDPAIPQLRDRLFDTVVSVNVFEHIADDMLALRHVHQVLQPGGRVILIVPAHHWLYGSMDRTIGHYRRYTKTSMAEKMATAGFRIKEQKYLNAVGAAGWFINGRVLRQSVPPRAQLKFFNRVVPVLKKLERSVSSPVGISLVTVAEREDNHCE